MQGEQYDHEHGRGELEVAVRGWQARHRHGQHKEHEQGRSRSSSPNSTTALKRYLLASARALHKPRKNGKWNGVWPHPLRTGIPPRPLSLVVVGCMGPRGFSFVPSGLISPPFPSFPSPQRLLSPFRAQKKSAMTDAFLRAPRGLRVRSLRIVVGVVCALLSRHLICWWMLFVACIFVVPCSHSLCCPRLLWMGGVLARAFFTRSSSLLGVLDSSWLWLRSFVVS